MMLSNILQALFGTINNTYLGQMIGVDAPSAVSVFFPVMFFFVAFVMGLSSGATVLIGQAWGAGEPDKVRAVAGATLTIVLLCAATIAVFGGLFSRPLLIALATPPDILEEASGYARIMMITMPLTFVFILLTAMMRGVGDTMTPLLALAISTVVGLAVTPALIRGWVGLPRLGVASAAWASAASCLLTLLWLAAHLLPRHHEFLHYRRGGTRARAGTAPHRVVEFGAVRYGDGLLRRDARQWNSVDASANLDLCNCRDRGAVRDRSQPRHRHRRHLGRLSDHLRRHVHSADELLHAGLAQARRAPPDLTFLAVPEYYGRHHDYGRAGGATPECADKKTGGRLDQDVAAIHVRCR